MKPVANKPVAKKPVAKKPVAKRPVAKKPTRKAVAAKKPVAKKPVTKRPVAKKPVAKKPVGKKPMTKKALVTALKKQIATMMRNQTYFDWKKLDKFASLTWKDFVSIIKQGKSFFVLEPQMYETAVTLNGDFEDVWGNKLSKLKNTPIDELEDVTMFYEQDGCAVTGSGTDRWLKVSQRLLTFLKKQ